MGECTSFRLLRKSLFQWPESPIVDPMQAAIPQRFPSPFKPSRPLRILISITAAAACDHGTETIVVKNPLTNPISGPPAGNPAGACAVPAEAAPASVTNDHSGDIRISDSVIRGNLGGSWYALPGISMHEDTRKSVVNSTLE
ncbi:MAG: hypothetical protein JWO30_3659 [Fibrobacteres bacterium]|nr:hypothetical protein [Fibrobacterota bacterium]